MIDCFPTELAIRIIEFAVLDLRFSSAYRRSVVYLASTSHAVYAIVAPILYHTMIISRKNCFRIKSFMLAEETRAAAARMCSFVRVLVYNPGLGLKIDTTFFTSLERIQALGSHARDILEQSDPSQPCLLRHLTVISTFFAHDVPKIPARARAEMTHACGFLPLFDDSELGRFHSMPAVWTREILDALPKLTHIGLVLVNNRPPENHDAIVEFFDMKALLVVVQTALAHRDGRLERVILRVGSRYIEHRRGDIEDLVRRVDNARFSIWWDERDISSWERWDEITNNDVMVGRDIWTDARASA